VASAAAAASRIVEHGRRAGTLPGAGAVA
jgi:hypothetical protein